MALAVSGSLLFAGTFGGGVFGSTDQGNTWVTVDNALSHKTAYALLAGGSFLLAGTDNGVFMSTNFGLSWTDVSAGLPGCQIRSLYTAGSICFAGTNGRGVWKRPFSDFTGVSEKTEASVPQRVALQPAYPNPFNPVTVIPFTTAAGGHVSMKIYDLAGKEIAVLVSDRFQPGRHEAKWNASSLPGGVYICRLEADGMIQTRKLVLMK
jgi:hypothetical protein